MTSREKLHHRLLFCLLGVLLCIAGCQSGGTMQAQGSEEQAKKAVEEFLTAWQSGKSITDYMAGNDKVVIGDEDWQGGVKLVSYKIPEAATLNGSHWRQKVELQLHGKSKPVPVYYAVTLADKTVILRSDFQY